jgi:hypothetical protein
MVFHEARFCMTREYWKRFRRNEALCARYVPWGYKLRRLQYCSTLLSLLRFASYANAAYCMSSHHLRSRRVSRCPRCQPHAIGNTSTHHCRLTELALSVTYNQLEPAVSAHRTILTPKRTISAATVGHIYQVVSNIIYWWPVYFTLFISKLCYHDFMSAFTTRHTNNSYY